MLRKTLNNKNHMKNTRRRGGLEFDGNHNENDARQQWPRNIRSFGGDLERSK
jgi:hypothetical protein